MKVAPLPQDMHPLLNEYGLNALDKARLSLLCFERGEFLYRAGTPVEWLMIVLSGRAKICRSSQNGKSLLLNFYEGQGFLGDIELMLELDYATTDVQALSAFTAIGIPYSLAPQLAHIPDFVLAIARKLAWHLERTTQNSMATALNTVEARLCSYISIAAENGRFHTNLTALAEILGTSYRHLMRTLEQLCQNGVLRREAGGFCVLDKGRLEALGGDAYRL